MKKKKVARKKNNSCLELKKCANNNPIGVFDSGMGGLTVVKALRHLLPNENIVYFGDTARLPYGTKSKKTITRFAREDTAAILSHNPKIIIVACNTVSSLALSTVKKTSSNVKSIGVVETSVATALITSKTNTIGVIGTSATIDSSAYKKAIIKIDPFASVTEIACPLFVSIAEEGFANHRAAELIAKTYLEPFKSTRIDTLVLGCTHYPILQTLIQKIIGKSIKIVDCASSTANICKQYLVKHHLLSNRKKGTLRVFLSDKPRSFTDIAYRFIGLKLTTPTLINVDSFP